MRRRHWKTQGDEVIFLELSIENCSYILDLMREDNCLGYWRLLSVRQMQNNEEGELVEFKKAYVSIYLQNTAMMSL
jgi:hypothetical protein